MNLVLDSYGIRNGSGHAWLDYTDTLPCEKGATISYRVWGSNIRSSKLYYIPMK